MLNAYFRKEEKVYRFFSIKGQTENILGFAGHVKKLYITLVR